MRASVVTVVENEWGIGTAKSTTTITRSTMMMIAMFRPVWLWGGGAAVATKIGGGPIAGDGWA